jgi:hypothetical protein
MPLIETLLGAYVASDSAKLAGELARFPEEANASTRSRGCAKTP